MENFFVKTTIFSALQALYTFRKDCSRFYKSTQYFFTPYAMYGSIKNFVFPQTFLIFKVFGEKE